MANEDRSVASGASLSPALSAAHEKGKSRRRRAILDAAHDIIQRSGEAGMTMRAMAAEAGVSPATPYNLFGSKQAILQAIYDEDYENFGRFFEDHASRDPLTRIFDLADVSIAYFELQPDFYRALIAILQRNSGSEVESNSWSLRLSYMRGLIEASVAAGELREDIPVQLIGTALVRIYKAVAQEWVEGVLTLDQARNELGISSVLVLASLVTPKGAVSFEQLRRRYRAAEG